MPEPLDQWEAVASRSAGEDDIPLTENQESERPVPLTAEERLALSDLIPSLVITPARGWPEGHYLLRPENVVGAVSLGRRSLVIRPKIGIRRLLFMLGYKLDPRYWRELAFDYAEDRSLFEAVIPAFSHNVFRAVRAGLLQGYRAEEDALLTVRGQIAFGEQLRQRFGVAPPIECRYDEFTEDIEPNRLLLAASERLARLRIRSKESRRNLAVMRSWLQNVTLVDYSARDVPEIHYTRLNQHYKPAVELARLILKSASFDTRAGTVAARGFLVNLSSAFEDFVVTALRESLKLTTHAFPQGARGRRLYLDDRGLAPGVLRLEPDFSWWEGARCIAVGDAKYKRTPASSGVKHPDIYQLLAYTEAAGLERGLLVYAAGEAEQRTYRVRNSETVLEVRTLDLEREPDEVLEQIDRHGDRLRELRAEQPALSALAA